MPFSFVSPRAPLYRVLTDDGIEQIHRTTVRALEEIGVMFFNPEALEIFRQAGAKVDGELVRIPEGLLNDVLLETPSRVVFYTRDGEPHMLLEGHEVHYGTTGTAPFWYNPRTGERELSTLETVATFARLCDYLPNIEWSMPLGVPSDVVVPAADRHQLYQVLVHNTKTVYASALTSEGMADLVEMAAVVAGGLDKLRERPFFTTGINPGSPFRYDHEVAGKLLVMARAGLPMLFNPMPMAGGTAPVTMAGTIVQALVEGLAGVALAQIVNPGCPVVPGGVLTTMDMRTTVTTYGAPELTLMMAGISEMYRFYQIPSYGTAGGTNSKVLDAQAAIEATYSLLGSTLAGSNMIHNVGLMDTGMTALLEAYVLGDEIIKAVRHLAGGIEVNDETLAFDVMKTVGPGGHYLEQPHTLKYFREHHQSKLIDRRNYDGWIMAGAKTMEERLTDQVHWILKNHEPKPLPEDVVGELANIVVRAEKRLS